MANVDLLTKTTGWKVSNDLTLTTNATKVDIPAVVNAVVVHCEDGAGRIAPEGADAAAIDADNVLVASGAEIEISQPRARAVWPIYVAGVAGPINYSIRSKS